MRWLENCISSIIEEDIDLQILVIDNNSSDETVQFVKNRFPEVRMFSQKENLGFGGANNLGYEIAKREGADYIYLLNQDTLSYKNTISKLIEIQKLETSIGVVSPLHLNDSGNKLDKKFEDYISSKSCPNYISDVTLNIVKEYYKIGFVNAASWLINMDVIANMGGLFSKAFFHYGEDSNFLSRLRYHGYHCVISSNTYIHHLREERNGNFSKAFVNKQLEIKQNEIMMNINKSFMASINVLYKYAGQQFFKGNFVGALKLVVFPIFNYSKIRNFRKSYLTKQIF